MNQDTPRSASISNVWQTQRRARPLWMQPLLLFCLYMTFVYMPFDLFWKPVQDDQEVWFGYMLTGWWAKATAPLHWLIYGAGAYGFWHMRTWMWPWAALYVLQVAIGMFVWVVLYQPGNAIAGIVVGGVFLIPAIALWRARHRFDQRAASAATS